jgi:membrane peptidoglycan carboxypeptidase
VADAVDGPITQLGMDVGLNDVREASIDAGLLPDSGFGEQTPDFSLGTATPSPIRMASAYGTFAADGTHTAPYSVVRITRGGNRIDLEKPVVTHPFTPQVAGDVNDALHESVTDGAAKAAVEGGQDGQNGQAALAGQDLAGLPGTAPDNTSASFVGYDPDMATAVSVFRIDPKTQELQPLTGLGGQPAQATGSPMPTDIWTDYMGAVGETGQAGKAAKAVPTPTAAN